MEKAAFILKGLRVTLNIGVKLNNFQFFYIYNRSRLVHDHPCRLFNFIIFKNILIFSFSAITAILAYKNWNSGRYFPNSKTRIAPFVVFVADSSKFVML